MDDPLGPKLMNDLFASTVTSPIHNSTLYTTVRQSIYTILTLYLQLIHVYIYMFLSTTIIHTYCMNISYHPHYDPRMNHTFPGTGKAMRRPVNTWADDTLGNLGQFTHRIRGTGILSYICWLILNRK